MVTAVLSIQSEPFLLHKQQALWQHSPSILNQET